MIDAPARITEIDGDYAVVLMDETGCGRCHEEGGCGGQNIGKMFCHQPRSFRVLNPGLARIGERVKISIAEDAVRRGAMLAYVWPLLALFGGALGGSALAGEAGAIGGAVAGVFCAWLMLRQQTRSRGAAQQRGEPFIRY